jgi:hypothetical protein
MLRLKATTAEDCAVLGALLQDALIPLSDIAFDPAEKRFMAVANRFRWEEASAKERIHSGFEVHGVTSLRRRDLDVSDRGQFLNLLTVTYVPEAVTLTFSGGALLQLLGEGLELRLADFGTPWPCESVPTHEGEGR